MFKQKIQTSYLNWITGIRAPLEIVVDDRVWTGFCFFILIPFD